MTRCHRWVAGLAVLATVLGGYAVMQVGGPFWRAQSAPGALSRTQPQAELIDCARGIACPIIGVPVPDVPLVDPGTPTPPAAGPDRK